MTRVRPIKHAMHVLKHRLRFAAMTAITIATARQTSLAIPMKIPDYVKNRR